MDSYSFLNAIHAQDIEQLYFQYLNEPDSIEPSWRAFFQGFDFGSEASSSDFFINKEQDNVKSNVTSFVADASIDINLQKQLSALNLVKEYAKRGHLFANTNPIRERRRHEPEITLSRFNLSSEDLKKDVSSFELYRFEG